MKTYNNFQELFLNTAYSLEMLDIWDDECRDKTKILKRINYILKSFEEDPGKEKRKEVLNDLLENFSEQALDDNDYSGALSCYIDIPVMIVNIIRSL